MHVITIDEHRKTLDTVAYILDLWHQADQPNVWHIIGGGTLSDTAAYSATIANCEFTLWPTTLLAMADACVGGKVGVNLPALWERIK